MDPNEKIAEGINEKVASNVEAVAATAAAQVDQANKDAEAIARAAAQSEHAARLSSIEGNVATWQSQTADQLAQMRAETAAALEALKTQLTPPPLPQPPVIVETPPPVIPADQIKDTAEPKPSLKQPDTNPPPPAQRKRILL